MNFALAIERHRQDYDTIGFDQAIQQFYQDKFIEEAESFNIYIADLPKGMQKQLYIELFTCFF